jgi:hypothetical protein
MAENLQNIPVYPAFRISAGFQKKGKKVVRIRPTTGTVSKSVRQMEPGVIWPGPPDLVKKPEGPGCTAFKTGKNQQYRMGKNGRQRLDMLPAARNPGGGRFTGSLMEKKWDIAPQFRRQR